LLLFSRAPKTVTQEDKIIEVVIEVVTEASTTQEPVITKKPVASELEVQIEAPTETTFD
jgi:hypothetical protein